MSIYVKLSDSEDRPEHLKQAINHITLGRDNQAIQILAQVLKSNPRDSQAWLWFARASKSLKKIDIALRNVSSISPGDPGINEEREKLESAVAAGCSDTGLIGHCIFCWAPVLKNSPACHYCNAHLDIRENFFHTKFFDHNQKPVEQKYILDAFQRFTQTALSEPKSAFLHFCLAITHINLDQWDEALDELLLAKSINPQDNPYESQLEILTDFMDDLGTFFSGSTALGEKTAEIPKPAPQAKKILIVEDSYTTRSIIRKMLSEKGYTVIEAKDGLEALQKYAETAPDLILLDIIMPGMDGYQTLNALKKSHNLGNTPVIMLTAKGKLIDRMKGKMAGSTEYLTKPFNTLQLMKKVEQHLAG